MKKPAILSYLVILFCVFAQAAFAENSVIYYMDLDDALMATPQKETKWMSEETGIDLMQWPIPWKEQVRNAITNTGFSPSGKQSNKKEHWVPFDKIPGEDSFPMKMRIKLASRRGYQKEVAYAEAQARLNQAEFSQEMKSISDEYTKGAEQRLADFVAGAEALKSKNKKTPEANTDHLGELPISDFEKEYIAENGSIEDFLKKKYEVECKKHFLQDTGGCGYVAYGLVQNNLQAALVPLTQIYDNENIQDGDVILSYPGGRALLRADPNGWVSNFIDPRASNEPLPQKVDFSKL